MKKLPIRIGADQRLYFRKAKNKKTGAFLNSGTMTYEIRTKDTDALVAQGSMPYVTSSDGNYEVVIESEVTSTLESGVFYRVIGVFDKSGINYREVMEVYAVE